MALRKSGVGAPMRLQSRLPLGGLLGGSLFFCACRLNRIYRYLECHPRKSGMRGLSMSYLTPDPARAPPSRSVSQRLYQRVSAAASGALAALLLLCALVPLGSCAAAEQA